MTALQAGNIPTAFPTRSDSPLPLFYWTPCIDGKLVQDSLSVMFKNGGFVNVPTIFGTDTDGRFIMISSSYQVFTDVCLIEGSYFAANASTQEEIGVFFQNNFPHLDNITTTEILDTYPIEASVPYHSAWFPSASKAYGEATFICPTINFLGSVPAKTNASTSGTISWAFRYNVHAPENTAQGFGVPHVWEAWAVFGPDGVNGTGGAPPSYYGSNAGVVPVVMNYWISFVRALDPNVLRYAGTPEWTSWGENSGMQRLRFETDTVEMESVPTDEKNRCSMWKSLAGSLDQ